MTTEARASYHRGQRALHKRAAVVAADMNPKIKHLLVRVCSCVIALKCYFEPPIGPPSLL
jgi:hypothetical protein